MAMTWTGEAEVTRRAMLRQVEELMEYGVQLEATLQRARRAFRRDMSQAGAFLYVRDCEKRVEANETAVAGKWAEIWEWSAQNPGRWTPVR